MSYVYSINICPCNDLPNVVVLIGSNQGSGEGLSVCVLQTSVM